MAKKTEKPKKARVQKSENDIFTALLGLAIITLVCSIGYVCWSSMQDFGMIINTDKLF